MSTTPQGWYPDPTGHFEQRYWDGFNWTEHVMRGGQGGVSPMPVAPPVAVQTSRPDQVQFQVAQQAGVALTAFAGGGHLLNEPVLVVNQKAKIIELTNEFAVYDQGGNHLGSVVQVGQSNLRKALRLVSNVDQFLKHKFEIRDNSGAVVLALTRPGKVFKSTLVVESPTGGEIGRIVQENMIGKIKFGLMQGANRIGSVNAENWRAWNFSIRDHAEQEIARITKTWEGLAKTLFTTADNYVVQIHRPLDEPLRSLVVASALGVDTALKQDSRGLS